MKNRILLSTGLALALVLAGGAYHQANAITSTGTAVAEIIEVIDLDCTGVDLDFGVILPSGVAGFVTMSTGGTATGDANATAISGGAAGECTLSGDPGYPADISITATTPLDDGVGGGVAMALDQFVFNYDGGGDDPAPATAVTLATAPGETLLVGARLAVGANQVAGTYTGSFTVDVSYQ